MLLLMQSSHEGATGEASSLGVLYVPKLSIFRTKSFSGPIFLNCRQPRVALLYLCSVASARYFLLRFNKDLVPCLYAAKVEDLWRA